MRFRARTSRLWSGWSVGVYWSIELNSKVYRGKRETGASKLVFNQRRALWM